MTLASDPTFAAPPPPVPAQDMEIRFIGARSALFWLALKTGFWTILTLGFYRFWMKTRLRRWYWSSIRPGGHPMEYVGDPWEELLGFFIAVVILTFYIGIVNLILMFVSFSVFNSSWVGYFASFLGVIPVWFYASYRARRYVLGRTRWRGVRFGLEKGAWGYAGRALIHWLITIVSLGILWPRMTFFLEKFRTDRTHFGSARLHQGGRWLMLYRAAIPMIIVAVLSIAFGLWVWLINPVFPGEAFDLDMIDRSIESVFMGETEAVELVQPARLLGIPLLLSALLFAAIHYRFVSKRILANHKTADGIALVSKLSGPRVTLIYVLGSFIAYLALVMGIFVMLGLAMMALGAEAMIEAQLGENTFLTDLPRWLSVFMFAAFYLGFFLMWGVLYNAFVTFPLMRHMAQTLSLTDVSGLAGISQRARDEFAEAEGFAEALDLGAAI